MSHQVNGCVKITRRRSAWARRPTWAHTLTDRLDRLEKRIEALLAMQAEIGNALADHLELSRMQVELAQQQADFLDRLVGRPSVRRSAHTHGPARHLRLVRE